MSVLCGNQVNCKGKRVTWSAVKEANVRVLLYNLGAWYGMLSERNELQTFKVR